MREFQAERVLQNSRCDSWEVLVHGVAGNVSHLERIFLPLAAESKQLTRVVEFQVCYSCSKVHQSFKWRGFENVCVRVDMKQIHASHLRPSREQMVVRTNSQCCSVEGSRVLDSSHALPCIEVPLVDLCFIAHREQVPLAVTKVHRRAGAIHLKIEKKFL